MSLPPSVSLWFSCLVGGGVCVRDGTHITHQKQKYLWLPSHHLILPLPFSSFIHSFIHALTLTSYHPQAQHIPSKFLPIAAFSIDHGWPNCGISSPACRCCHPRIFWGLAHVPGAVAFCGCLWQHLVCLGGTFFLRHAGTCAVCWWIVCVSNHCLSLCVWVSKSA